MRRAGRNNDRARRAAAAWGFGAPGRRAALLWTAALAIISFPVAAGVGWLVWTAAAGDGAPAAPGPGFALGGAGLAFALLVALTPDGRLRAALVLAGTALALGLVALAPQAGGNLAAAVTGDMIAGIGQAGAGAAGGARAFFPAPSAIDAALTGVLVAAGHAGLVAAAATLAGYVCSRTAFSWRAPLLIGLFAAQAFPTMALLAPQFLALERLGLIDTPAGAILALSALELPFAILFMKAAFDRIPPVLEMSALADGASRIGAFRDAALPLAAPAAAAVSVLAFMVGWGDYVIARVVFLSQERWTFSMYVHRLADESLGVDYGALASLALLYALPPVLFIGLALRAVARPGGWRSVI